MRQAMIASFVMLGFLSLGAPGASAEKTMDELAKECGGVDLEKFEVTSDDSALCFGYINGAISSMLMKQLQRGECWFDIPSNTPSTDFPVILMRYLKAHPAAIRMPTSQSISAALSNAFPCKP
jgi:hypothetical protein